MGDVMLEPRKAFEGLALPGGAALRVEERAGLQIAAVVARSRDARALVEKAQTLGIALRGIGPGKWLAVAEADAAPLAEQLSQELGALAAVTELSDAYAVLRVAGSRARALFEKGLAIDLHPRAFKPGDVTATLCGHINVVIWQLDVAPTYEVALYRSYAASFHHWLVESAATLALS
jgi:methylglutamate dehydrogenase subunit D